MYFDICTSQLYEVTFYTFSKHFLLLSQKRVFHATATCYSCMLLSGLILSDWYYSITTSRPRRSHQPASAPQTTVQQIVRGFCSPSTLPSHGSWFNIPGPKMKIPITVSPFCLSKEETFCFRIILPLLCFSNI